MPKLKADEGRIYFYRTASLVGFAVQPSIMLDGAKVGSSKPGGFFYVDASSGPHEISAASDPDRKLAMTLEKGDIKYVKISPAFGDTTGEIKFDVVSEADAMKVLPDLAFSGETD